MKGLLEWADVIFVMVASSSKQAGEEVQGQSQVEAHHLSRHSGPIRIHGPDSGAPAGSQGRAILPTRLT